MPKLLIIFIDAFGRSSQNESVQQVEDSIPWGYLETELKAQCTIYRLKAGLI